MALLEVKGLTKQFGGLIAVEDVDFHVNSGEIISIIGPNGAGKTTIFNMLTGVYQVTRGTISFEGKSIENKMPKHIVRAGIARTFQNIRLFGNMRVIENIMVGNHINTKYSLIDAMFRTKKFKNAERESAQKAVDILKSLDLDQYIHSYAKSLPYGMQRKLEIARAIATDAKLIILDEPAAGMNPQESEELMDFIRGLRDRGYTILLIEHDMSLVMKISDRIYVIEYGRKIAEGLPSEIAHDKRVIEAYLGSGGVSKDDE